MFGYSLTTSFSKGMNNYHVYLLFGTMYNLNACYACLSGVLLIFCCRCD